MSEPAAEVHINEALVADLLREQHPDLTGLPIHPVGSGWDNAIFRLGSDLLVRLLRRSLSVPLMVQEQRWLPALAPRLPLPIPVPIRTGLPGSGYPWPWSITPWFLGTTAENVAAEHLGTVAVQPGKFVRTLQSPAGALGLPGCGWSRCRYVAETSGVGDRARGGIARRRRTIGHDRETGPLRCPSRRLSVGNDALSSPSTVGDYDGDRGPHLRGRCARHECRH